MSHKLIHTIKTLAYEERLRKIDLPTLVYRRSRGDMIETYKNFSGMYDRKIYEDLFVIQEDTNTRDHSKNIYKRRSRINRRKYAFCGRVVNIWNNLLDDVVNAATIITFEKRDNKCWKND